MSNDLCQQAAQTTVRLSRSRRFVLLPCSVRAVVSFWLRLRGRNEPPKAGGDNVLPENLASKVVETYYMDVFDWPNRVRNLGQAGFAIASALAGGLIVGGYLSDVHGRHSSVLIIGLVSIALWFLTAGLFVYTISVPLPAGPQDGEDGDRYPPEPQAAFTVVAGAQASRETIAARLRLAHISTFLAAITTAITVILLLATGTPVERTTAQVNVTASESQLLRSICPHLFGPGDSNTFVGDIANNTVESPIVNIRVSDGACNGLQTVDLPQGAITAIESCKPGGLATTHGGSASSSASIATDPPRLTFVLSDTASSTTSISSTTSPSPTTVPRCPLIIRPP